MIATVCIQERPSAAAIVLDIKALERRARTLRNKVSRSISFALFFAQCEDSRFFAPWGPQSRRCFRDSVSTPLLLRWEQQR